MLYKAEKNWLSFCSGTVLIIAVFLFSATAAGKQDSLPPAEQSTDPNRPKEPKSADHQHTDPGIADSDTVSDPNWVRPRSDERLKERRRMTEHIRKSYGLKNDDVLNALMNVPRHWFVMRSEQNMAYADMPLPIGHGQTISQPFIVAYMTSLLELDKDKKVLEVGTGSGYQAAVLNEFTPHVYSIEIIKALAEAGEKRLKKSGYKTIKTRTADGYWGWQEHAPFDAIIVTSAADHVPPPLIEQLKPKGKMCIPVGGAFRVQNLMLITKDEKGKVTSQALMPVRFVPFVRSRPR